MASLCSVITTVLALVASSALHGTRPPTNERLIAAMPEGVESVIVMRHSLLHSDESLFKNQFGGCGYGKEGELTRLASQAVDTAIPIVCAMGGSGFQVPPDTGMTGDFNRRSIWIVRKTIEPFRRQLEGENEKYASFIIDGVKVFKTSVLVYQERFSPTRKPFLVAFPDDHIVVSAESEKDIEEMISALKAKETKLSDRWRGVAKGIDVESPVVLLRVFPEDRVNARRIKWNQDYKPMIPQTAVSCVAPHGFPAEKTKIKSFGWALPNVKQLAYEVAVSTEAPKVAIDWYKKDCFPRSVFSWDVKVTPHGFKGHLRFREGAESQHVGLVFILLFGAFVAI